MKTIKAILFSLFLALSFPVLANTLTSDTVNSAGWGNLSEAQKAEVIKMVADASSKNGPVETVTTVQPEKVSKWAEIGVQVAQGMAGAAKELGVAINDFAKTPVGKWTMFLIIWHIVGGVIMHAFGALCVLILGLVFFFILVRRLQSLDVKYSETETTWLGRQKIVSLHRPQFTEGDFWALFATLFVTLIVTLTTLFTY